METEEVGIKRLAPTTRAVLLLAGALVLIAGAQLFALPEQTERFFAWTIAVPLTAAFMGAGYFSSFALVVAGAAERSWCAARISTWSPTIFSVAILIATLQNLTMLHLGDGRGDFARFAAWAWIAVYVAVPVALVALIIRQTCARGAEPPRAEPLPLRLRTTLLAQGATMLAIGVGLFVAPGLTSRIWPWTLTAFGAQIVGAWLLGLGVAAVEATFENDWRRMRGASLSYLVFGVLQLIALARYPRAVEWDEAPALLYTLFLLSITITGCYAVMRAWRTNDAPDARPRHGFPAFEDGGAAPG
jgi:hypothetical protein